MKKKFILLPIFAITPLVAAFTSCDSKSDDPIFPEGIGGLDVIIDNYELYSSGTSISLEFKNSVEITYLKEIKEMEESYWTISGKKAIKSFNVSKSLGTLELDKEYTFTGDFETEKNEAISHMIDDSQYIVYWSYKISYSFTCEKRSDGTLAYHWNSVPKVIDIKCSSI